MWVHKTFFGHRWRSSDFPWKTAENVSRCPHKYPVMWLELGSLSAWLAVITPPASPLMMPTSDNKNIMWYAAFGETLDESVVCWHHILEPGVLSSPPTERPPWDLYRYPNLDRTNTHTCPRWWHRGWIWMRCTASHPWSSGHRTSACSRTKLRPETTQTHTHTGTETHKHWVISCPKSECKYV